ncbi:hypothetical protein GCM10012275_09690 [Longimycelium tulufanense]|uniref:Uncharacterized protein n=1 Tax=Longimycelium tulufanense TaxID=907463 RepID=A0A8J3CCU8_9PSEU|nr:hypothetical protein [Longimycelium tulufanense]GGM40816.1 hypothetical protein GCM10012275_09690 [Longimycelium tulufanense]
MTATPSSAALRRLPVVVGVLIVVAVVGGLLWTGPVRCLDGPADAASGVVLAGALEGATPHVIQAERSTETAVVPEPVTDSPTPDCSPRGEHHSFATATRLSSSDNTAPIRPVAHHRAGPVGAARVPPPALGPPPQAVDLTLLSVLRL